MPDVTLNAATAAQFLQKRYADLQVLAQKLVDTGNATKQPLPCSVISDYNKAVKEYLEVGNQIFAQLNAHKIVIEQVVYRDGKPALDPNDETKMLTKAVVAPLRPAIFVPGPGCPDATRLDGASTPLGIAPAIVAAIPTALAAGRVIGIWLFRLGMAYLTVEALTKIVIIVRGYAADHVDPVVLAKAYTDCIEKAVAAGVPPLQAAAACGKQVERNSGLGILGYVGLATLLVGAGVGLAVYFSKRKNGNSNSVDNDDDDADMADAFTSKPKRRKPRQLKEIDEELIEDIAATAAEPGAKRKRKQAALDVEYFAPGEALRSSDFGDARAADTLDACPCAIPT